MNKHIYNIFVQKMGFDLFIVQKLHFNENTGLPFVYKSDGARAPYDPIVFRIPDHFKRLVSLRGPHWHEYIKSYDTDWEYEASADDFLANYPKWTIVFEGLEDDYSWTEKEHDLFKAALIWLSDKGGYYINWSY